MLQCLKAGSHCPPTMSSFEGKPINGILDSKHCLSFLCNQRGHQGLAEIMGTILLSMKGKVCTSHTCIWSTDNLLIPSKVLVHSTQFAVLKVNNRPF